LSSADLQAAFLASADLQGANLGWAHLQGAYLTSADLQDAFLLWAQLQGADLREAQLQGAYLASADLQGADLGWARLQGADLRRARLQGADLRVAQLQGAILWKADLQGADLREANLYAAEGQPSESVLIDAREIIWEPLPESKFRTLSNALKKLIQAPDRRQQVLERLAAASRPECGPSLSLKSCLARSDTPFVCDKRYDPENPVELAAFKQQLQAYLAKLACQSPWIAQGLVQKIRWADADSSRQGLAAVLKKRLDDQKCRGLQGLSQEWKDKLKAIK
jgi:uncharacterized protein YjbI with pentapeptide repeats